jgi:hypothetical protein
MIGLSAVKARLRRLQDLSTGLSREIQVWQAGNDPMLFRERRAYLRGLREGQAGLEAARVAMAGVLQRMMEEINSEQRNS